MIDYLTSYPVVWALKAILAIAIYLLILLLTKVAADAPEVGDHHFLE